MLAVFHFENPEQIGHNEYFCSLGAAVVTGIDNDVSPLQFTARGHIDVDQGFMCLRRAAEARAPLPGRLILSTEGAAIYVQGVFMAAMTPVSSDGSTWALALVSAPAEELHLTRVG